MFHGCGKPQLGRRRRSINPKFVEPKSIDDLNNFTFDDGDSTFALIQEDVENDDASRQKRNTNASNRELTFEPYKFPSTEDNFSDEADTTSKKGKKKQKKKPGQSGAKKEEEKEPCKLILYCLKNSREKTPFSY